MNVIKQSIKAQKLKQWQASNRIGINNGRLSSILNGNAEPNRNERRKLEHYFHAPLEMLLEKELQDGVEIN